MNIKYKILFYLPIISSGGAERVTINILKELNAEQFELYLLVNNLENEAYLESIPKEIKIISMNKRSTISSIYTVFRTLKKIKPDLVYSTLFRSSVLLDLVTRILAKKPYVLLRNPTSPKYIIEQGNISSFLRFMLDIAYRRADLVLAQTPQMKEELMEFHGLKSSEIQTLLNPIDKRMINESICNQTNPFDSQKINVVVAGRLHHDKGFDILLKAFKKVVEEDARYHLTIIGNDVGEGKMLNNLTLELELSKFVDFLGFQKNPYKFFYFSDLYVLSSRVEGLPNTVLENLYLKKPIVATECTPFMHTLVEDKKSAFIIPTENTEALSQAILNYEQLELPMNSMKNSVNINQFFLDKVRTRKG